MQLQYGAVCAACGKLIDRKIYSAQSHPCSVKLELPYQSTDVMYLAPTSLCAHLSYSIFCRTAGPPCGCWGSLLGLSMVIFIHNSLKGANRRCSSSLSDSLWHSSPAPVWLHCAPTQHELGNDFHALPECCALDAVPASPKTAMTLRG